MRFNLLYIYTCYTARYTTCYQLFLAIISKKPKEKIPSALCF